MLSKRLEDHRNQMEVVALDNPQRTREIIHAGNAYFCCHEPQETGKLVMEVSTTSLSRPTSIT